jgi:hypothetical protein
MRWPTLAFLGFLASLIVVPATQAEGARSYAVLIISRQTLQVSTSCEIGVFINDQLVTRLFQDADTSLNLPPGEVAVRLKRLGAQTPGCEPSGITTSQPSRITLRAGDIVKYSIAPGPYGLTLRPAPIEY